MAMKTRRQYREETKFLGPFAIDDEDDRSLSDESDSETQVQEVYNDQSQSDNELSSMIPSPESYRKIVEDLTEQCADALTECISKDLTQGLYAGVLNPKRTLKHLMNKPQPDNLIVFYAWKKTVTNLKARGYTGKFSTDKQGHLHWLVNLPSEGTSVALCTLVRMMLQALLVSGTVLLFYLAASLRIKTT